MIYSHNKNFKYCKFNNQDIKYVFIIYKKYNQFKF